jgi:hypothetical protein
VSRSGFAACSSAEQVTRSLSDQRLSPTSANPSRSFLLMKAGKQLVRRLVEEGVNVQSTAILNEVADGAFAELARRWISPFRGSFPDFQMQIVNLIEETTQSSPTSAAPGTHQGEWLGLPPTGRRFENIDEIYIFRIEHGKLVAAHGVEDNLARLRQLGIELSAATVRPPESPSAPHDE